MAPSRSDKRRMASGLGVATSVLLSPQSPQHSPSMAFSKFFGLPSTSGSTSSSSRARGSPTSPWSSQSHHRGDHDAPPPYDPQDEHSDYNEWAAKSKMPVAQQTAHSREVHFPTPDLTYNTTDARGEDPLQVLRHYDIVIIFDDSYSMLVADNKGRRTRWNQVGEFSLPSFPRARYRRDLE